MRAHRKQMMAGGGLFSALGKANEWLKKHSIISRGLGYVGGYLGPSPLGIAATGASNIAAKLGYGRRRRKGYRRRRKATIGMGKRKRATA